MIKLTEQQSLELFWLKNKSKKTKNKYKYTSKSQWKCIGCLTTIFVNYLTDNTSSIYCETNENCRSLKQQCYLHPNLAEINYFKLLKEEHFNAIIDYDETKNS